MRLVLDDESLKIKASKRLFVMCWVAYCTIYFGRINYYAAMAGIVKEGLFTKSQAGLIGTVFFFCYGGGQFLSGLLADHLSPYRMILAGLTVSALSNFFMTTMNNYVVMALIWGINGLAQSMVWPPILNIISKVLSERVRERACLDIASTTPAGTFLTYFIAMILLKYESWKSVFYFAAAVLAVVSCLWGVLSVQASRTLGHGLEPKKTAAPGPNDSRHSDYFGRLLLSSGAIFIAISVLFHGMLKDGVNSWVPTMMMESYKVSPSFSVFLTMFLPIINLGGAYAAAYLYKKRMRQNEMKVAALLFGVSIVPLFLLLFIGRVSMGASMAMLALFTTIMLGFNYITITLLPIRFARHHRASTVSGLFNSITYIGCAISNFGFGFLSEKIGWQKTIGVWVLLAFLAVVLCLFSLKPWNSFIEEKQRRQMPSETSQPGQTVLTKAVKK